MVSSDMLGKDSLPPGISSDGVSTWSKMVSTEADGSAGESDLRDAPGGSLEEAIEPKAEAQGGLS